ncbi:MAG: cobalamin-dependent protein [Spirochaetaceae bacterium]|jgi:methanogenic corrinoid protein MtbC1|nr:cobalamin-dependent protein [Spirochaetaceae bacterium]
MLELQEIALSLQSGKAQETMDLISRAIAEQYAIEDILKYGLIAGMAEVERRYRKNEIFITEVLITARALNMGIRLLKPFLDACESSQKGTVVIGTVKGDIQEIEKNLMSVMMRGMGLRVVDLGAAVTSERFIEAAEREKACIIACTAALTTTMPHMKALVQAVIAAKLRDQVKIMVSGAPVTERYCSVIGADLYAPDAVSAAEMAEAYCNSRTAG